MIWVPEGLYFASFSVVCVGGREARNSLCDDFVTCLGAFFAGEMIVV